MRGSTPACSKPRHSAWWECCSRGGRSSGRGVRPRAVWLRLRWRGRCASSFARRGGGGSCVSGACGVLPAARGSLPGMLGAHGAAWDARCSLRRSVLLGVLGGAYGARCCSGRSVLVTAAGYGARCCWGACGYWLPDAALVARATSRCSAAGSAEVENACEAYSAAKAAAINALDRAVLARRCANLRCGLGCMRSWGFTGCPIVTNCSTSAYERYARGAI